MSDLSHLFENNRLWAQRIVERDPGFFQSLTAQQSPGLPVDRLFRQPRARQRDRRAHAGRAVRASERRQRGGPHRPQLPVGAAVRRRRAEGGARHRLRPLRLRRRARGVLALVAGLDRQLAAPRPGRARSPRRRDRRAARRRPANRAAVRAQRDRSGAQRLPDDDRPGRVAARTAPRRPRLDLRRRRRPAPRSALHDQQRRRARAGVSEGAWRGRPRVAVRGFASESRGAPASAGRLWLSRALSSQ